MREVSKCVNSMNFLSFIQCGYKQGALSFTDFPMILHNRVRTVLQPYADCWLKIGLDTLILLTGGSLKRSKNHPAAAGTRQQHSASSRLTVR